MAHIVSVFIGNFTGDRIMFGGLKQLAIDKALGLLEEDMRARLAEKVELFRNLKPSDIQDDVRYQAVVVDPLWLYLKLQSGAAIVAVQKVIDVDVQSRFGKGLFHVRNELIRTEGDSIALDPQFLDKAGPTLIAAFKE
jgi:hypothetical protein